MLGTLPGFANLSDGAAINELGQVGGRAGDNTMQHALLWDNGAKTDLGALPGGNNSFVEGINDAGVAVGQSSIAMVYQPGQGMHTLNSVLDSTANGITFLDARDINNAGQIVVTGLAPSGVTHDYLAQLNGSVQSIPLNPTSINEAGVVAGSIQGNAAIWTNATGLTLLGRLPGATSATARGINDAGQLVGFWKYNVGTRIEDGDFAFVWEQGRGMEHLDALLDESGYGWHIVIANDVNNLGQIVADAIGPDGASHAVVLTPVPEPTSWGLGMMGLVGATVLLRHQRARARKSLN